MQCLVEMIPEEEKKLDTILYLFLNGRALYSRIVFPMKKTYDIFLMLETKIYVAKKPWNFLVSRLAIGLSGGHQLTSFGSKWPACGQTSCILASHGRRGTSHGCASRAFNASRAAWWLGMGRWRTACQFRHEQMLNWTTNDDEWPWNILIWSSKQHKEFGLEVEFWPATRGIDSKGDSIDWSKTTSTSGFLCAIPHWGGSRSLLAAHFQKWDGLRYPLYLLTLGIPIVESDRFLRHM